MPTFVMNINEVYQDLYLYNISNAGTLSFGPGNCISGYEVDGTTKFIIELGYVANQTFAGGDYNSKQHSYLYIATEAEFPSQYVLANETNSVSGTQNTTDFVTTNNFEIESMSFGEAKILEDGTTQAWYQLLGNPDTLDLSPTKAQLAYNF